jgi:hypothetical protein
MSDPDFGTVSARRADHAREIEVLRKHRESLVKMLADVDAQIHELELSVPDTPGSRPLVTTTDYAEYDDTIPPTQPGGGLRVILILGAAFLGLALIGWLIWRASSDRPAATGTVIEETATAAEETGTTALATAPESEPVATTAPAAAATMRITPRSHDYGLVRKGTRATRQFQFTNTSDDPVTIAVSRSSCRCLYYEYEALVPPKASESITVTVDGAKAKAGTLRETIKVTAKANPAIGTSFDVIATVR